jgi:hypothetical protein
MPPPPPLPRPQEQLIDKAKQLSMRTFTLANAVVGAPTRA